MQSKDAMKHIDRPSLDPRIAQVGNRVRDCRKRKGMTRQMLADQSGISLRYLAQLEGGSGNISIALLHRIADALGHQIEWLVAKDEFWTPQTLKMAALFRDADTATQARVMRQLTPISPENAKSGRVTLIGLRGAGKSTLAMAAGAALGVPFVELNKEIEDLGGMPIAEIIALYGPEGYRKLEAEALDMTAAVYGQMILAVAGGVVDDPQTFGRLLETSHTIWVKASAQNHMDRVRAQGDERPMAGNPQAMAQLRALLASRKPLYAQADAQLDTSNRSVAQSVAELLDLIRDKAFLTSN
ncbi:MAG: helix-turn-helix transcriptional regulator [Sulfitobacter sp.]